MTDGQAAVVQAEGSVVRIPLPGVDPGATTVVVVGGDKVPPVVDLGVLYTKIAALQDTVVAQQVEARGLRDRLAHAEAERTRQKELDRQRALVDNLQATVTQQRADLEAAWDRRSEAEAAAHGARERADLAAAERDVTRAALADTRKHVQRLTTDCRLLAHRLLDAQADNGRLRALVHAYKAPLRRLARKDGLDAKAMADAALGAGAALPQPGPAPGCPDVLALRVVGGERKVIAAMGLPAGGA